MSSKIEFNPKTGLYNVITENSSIFGKTTKTRICSTRKIAEQIKCDAEINAEITKYFWACLSVMLLSFISGLCAGAANWHAVAVFVNNLF